MSNHDQMVEALKSCTGLSDNDTAKQYLEQAGWDLMKAIQALIPGETQKLPSEVESNDVHMNDVSNQPSFSNNVTVSDDYFSPASTSSSRITFNIYNHNLDTTESFRLSENDTVDHLKTAILLKWNAPKCQQVFTGWPGPNSPSDEEKLKNLPLVSPVQLTVSYDDVARSSKKTVNGIHDSNSSSLEDGKFKLHIFDEIHHRDYTVYHSGTKKVFDVKQDMFNKSDIPVGQQIWSGWPPSCTSDDLTLGQLGLNTPQHDLSFRAAPVMVSQGRFDKKKRYTRISTPDSDTDTSYSSNDDEDMQSVIADDLFEDTNNFPPKNNCSCSLVPAEFENETMGSIQFAVSFQERYGAAHPDFFPGTLDQAFKEACSKPAKDRKLLAVYLHHNDSVLTNVFCSQLLCFESVLQYLAEHFIVWGWDVTLDNNKTFLLHALYNVLGSVAAHSVRSMKTEKYPIILIITRVRRNTEILSVIHGNVGLNELLSSLIQTVDMFSEQQITECKEEEQRNARDMIKFEQDQAYQESLEVDRAKFEAKRKQEQLELEEQQKVESAKQQEAAKKEAHRRALESKLPPEPADGSDGLTKIRIRVQQQFLERKFLKTDTLQLLLDFLVVKGYDPADYKLITSFPRKDVTSMNPESTLEELKMYPQETLILEER
ncbi:FAS-associated factor 1 isoform X2 [Planococcus citri]|uniref:FAS-associated factor 1 isoform X2 n=1 Tax=Planococcus citri TaxID=170843 RepID=UPI0031F73834